MGTACRSDHCTLIILQCRRVVLLYLKKRVGCVHKKHDGALTAYMIVTLTVWTKSIGGERMWWKETLTTWAEVIAGVKVRVVPVVVRLREWEDAIWPKRAIETWEVFIIWVQWVVEIRHPVSIYLRSSVWQTKPVTVVDILKVAWRMPYLDIILMNEYSPIHWKVWL